MLFDIYIYVCVCVCVRERERERERDNSSHIYGSIPYGMLEQEFFFFRESFNLWHPLLMITLYY